MNRIRELDGLRATAVIAVVVFHFLGEGALVGGFLGVDIFFVISGYLITSLLLREQAMSGTVCLRRFYLRRARRLLPALFALLLVVGIVEVLRTLKAGGSPFDTITLLFLSGTSTMNWARALGLSGGGILGHIWSLSVEEQFYFLWPLALSAGLRLLGKQRTLIAVCVTILLVVVWRILLVEGGALPERIYNGTDTRADALLIGCLLALQGVETIPQWVRKTGSIIGATLLLLMMSALSWTSTFMNTLGFTVAAVCSAFLIMEAVAPHPLSSRILGSPAAVWVGLRSYSLYLWHYPVLIWLNMFEFRTAAEELMLGAILSVTLADLSFRFIERPLLARRTLMSQAASSRRDHGYHAPASPIPSSVEPTGNKPGM